MLPRLRRLSTGFAGLGSNRLRPIFTLASLGPFPKSGVSSMLASLDGEVRDQGLIEHEDEKVSTSNWFASANGGAGLVLDILSAADATVKAMIADDNSVWLFGEYHGDREAQQQMWVERIQF